MNIDRATDALVIVDLQLDFLPGGALAVTGGDEIIGPISHLARAFGTVVATQDFHPRGHVSFASAHGRAPFDLLSDPRALPGGEAVLWPDHCVAGSAGARLAEGLPDEAISVILRKGTRREVDSYSAFREELGPDGQRASTGLGALLRTRGIERLFVCGLARDFCVRATALDAVAEGFATFLLDDLTRSVAPERAVEVTRALSDGRVRIIASKSVRS